jgi:hypothetical protein
MSSSRKTNAKGTKRKSAALVVDDFSVNNLGSTAASSDQVYKFHHYKNSRQEVCVQLSRIDITRPCAQPSKYPRVVPDLWDDDTAGEAFVSKTLAGCEVLSQTKTPQQEDVVCLSSDTHTGSEAHWRHSASFYGGILGADG